MIGKWWWLARSFRQGILFTIWWRRFGPVVLPWRKHCSTMREFLHHGLMRSSIYHFVTGVFLLFWSAVSQRTPISFVRFYLSFQLFSHPHFKPNSGGISSSSPSLQRRWPSSSPRHPTQRSSVSSSHTAARINTFCSSTNYSSSSV